MASSSFLSVSIVFIRVILLSWRTALPSGFSALVLVRSNYVFERKKKKFIFRTATPLLNLSNKKRLQPMGETPIDKKCMENSRKDLFDNTFSILKIILFST